MKDYFEGRPTADIDSKLPAGKVQFGEKWVESLPAIIPEHSAQCYIKGKLDTIVAFDDGSYGVIDFKTSEPKPQHVAFYGRQLHAYVHALEHAALGKFALSPISTLGLLVVAPNAMNLTASGQIAYLGGVTWMEIPRDDSLFSDFLGQVLDVLEQPSAPPASEKCVYCQYREQARQTGL
jgi:hypothetical protein